MPLQVNAWSGSIEIGVTTCDPQTLDFPTSATGFREGTWVMSGASIMKDGHTLVEEYGQDLDQLTEGDTVSLDLPLLIQANLDLLVSGAYDFSMFSKG